MVEAQKSLRTSALVRGLLLPLAWALLGAADPAPALKARETWYDFKFYGNKVGHLHAKDSPTTVNGRPAFLVHRASSVTVRRQEDVVRMESTTDAYFTPDGQPMKFNHTRLEGREQRTVTGYRDGDVLVIRSDVGGNIQEKRLPMKGGSSNQGPCPGHLYLASSLEVLFYNALPAKQPLSGCAVDEAEGEISAFSMKQVGMEGPNYVVEETLGPLVSKAIVSKDGTMERTEMVGIGAEFVRTTQEDALRLDATVDIFSSALFSLPRPLPPGHTLDGLVVRIGSKSGKTPTFLADARQSGKVVGTAVELRLVNARAPKKAQARPIKDAKVKAFLKETPYEPIKDERLVAVVERVLGSEKDAWTSAKAINRFVHDHIKKKTLARAFATASEALETREGDCTEHSVLFSALAKIAGIPTRLATGLVYVGGANPVFGYHEWVEVYVGGDWIAMDPTFGQDLADSTHLKFAVGQSDADGLREAGMVAAAMIGDLDLKVLEYTTSTGERVRF